jgi:hypothetical protein
LAGTAEDPFLWYNEKRGWKIIAHGMCYAPFDALYFYSQDLVTWHLSDTMCYSYDVQWLNGSSSLFIRVERPQLFFNGGDTGTPVPALLFNGVCDDGLACLETPGLTWTLARPLRT